MALYGNDMDETVSPLDAGLAWTVDFKDENRDFVGKAALVANGARQQALGLILEDKGILRSHQKVFTAQGEGETAAAAFRRPSRSPSPWPACLSASRPATSVEVDIRGKRLKARVVKPPSSATARLWSDWSEIQSTPFHPT
jgi:aminomethyltransferase